MFHSASPILFVQTNKGMCRFRYIGNDRFDVVLMKGPDQRREINRNTEHLYRNCDDPVLVDACKKELERFHSDEHEVVLYGNQLIGWEHHAHSNYVRAMMLQFAHNVVDEFSDVQAKASWLSHVMCDLLKFTNDKCAEYGISKDRADIQKQIQECTKIIRKGVGL